MIIPAIYLTGSGPPRPAQPDGALEPARGFAALALYNGSDAQAAFRGKWRAALNPPAVEAFAALRRLAGEDAHTHLLRLVAAYRGW